MQVRRLGQIGAEVSGVDVKTLDDASFAVIYRAWLESNVVVVPGQELEISDFLRYSRRFGTLARIHPSRRAIRTIRKSPWLKERLDGLNGAFAYGGRKKSVALLNEEDREWPPVLHPIIRTHPETGRKALYFDPGKILRIEGLEPAESDAVIDDVRRET
jgi:alpha-ketoglutarate-dependent taurine dioxygenase